MSVQIETAIKRTRSYWFVDGFTEIAAGGLFVLLAGIFLIQGNASKPSSPSWLLSIAGEISIVKILGILAGLLSLWWLKDHFTYPRTGFVRGNRISTAQALILLRNVILMLLLPMIGLLGVTLLTTSTVGVVTFMPAWFPIGLGFIWGILCVLAGKWLGLLRFQIIGGLILLAGIKIGIWQFVLGLPVLSSNQQPWVFQSPLLEVINRTLFSLGFLILASGIIVMSSGFVTFLRYRKENPAPYPEDV